MVSKTFSVAAVALAASLVSAQTSTLCNPLKKTCPADPAFGDDKATCEWSSGACDVFNAADGTTLKYDDTGALFVINKGTDAPTITTGKYLFFGRVDVEVQAAAGAGIVTSIVLQSDDLDEIDIEFVGADNAHVQTNYFSKGNTATYDRGETHPVANPCGEMHTYSVEWTSESLNWLIDGNTVRTLQNTGITGPDGFPQTPMQVKLGTWVAGLPTTPKGTVEWAGGLTDFSKAPFIAHYKSISITDYAGGSGPDSKAVKQYVYGDNTGDWQSIKVIGGSGSASSSSSASSSAAASSAQGSSSAAPSSTKAASSSAEKKTTSASADKTTMTTAASTTSAAATPSGSGSAATTPASTGSGSSVSSSVASVTSSSTVPTHSSGATQNIAAFGGLAIAGALMVSQLL